jgi:hypothetical protein
MTKTEATASIFLTAFHALAKQERRAVIEQRRHEPSRSVESYVKDRPVQETEVTRPTLRSSGARRTEMSP